MATTAKDVITKLYIGYFNRAPDPDGLNYWIGRYNGVGGPAMTAAEIAQSFSVQVEATNTYAYLKFPSINNPTTAAELITEIYHNLFNRAPDAAGLAYWTDQLVVQHKPVGQIVIDIISGAYGPNGDPNDRAIIDNKTLVAEYYADQALKEGVLWSTQFVENTKSTIASVTSDADSVVSAKSDIDGIVAEEDAKSHPGENFNLVSETVVGADGQPLTAMRLTGDMAARIDFTTNSQQVKGLDLNGNGVIQQDGRENNNPTPLDDGKTFQIIDAYERNHLNQGDPIHNYLGNIAYDGTGFQGDGTHTNGNIFLGGLGADTALGGIGNDFLAGGGVWVDRYVQTLDANGRPVPDSWTDVLTGQVYSYKPNNADTLSGGRNADFFFVELSKLDPTDGNNTIIDGGITADDNSAGTIQSAQDSDWLLLEGSDDDEPIKVILNDYQVNRDGTPKQHFNSNQWDASDNGYVDTRAGAHVGELRDIENVDASGNLYGFLSQFPEVILGGRAEVGPVNDPGNNGIGSSAQLDIQGSGANNIIIGGYDNDVIQGAAGNDLLMGGNLNKLINPNLLQIKNDGRDELIGDGMGGDAYHNIGPADNGKGNDDIVFEADGGIIEGGAVVQRNDSAPDAAWISNSYTDSSSSNKPTSSSSSSYGGGIDTLWLNDYALGRTVTNGEAAPTKASDITTDGVLRLDLGVGKEGGLDNYAGYGGADVNMANGNYTSDQSNYKPANAGLRVQVQDMENVIATGLGAVDYYAAGTNNPDLKFDNHQNFWGYEGDLDLRGTRGDNILYANTGNDVIEGRQGDDQLSGGKGHDDFIFATRDIEARQGGLFGPVREGVDVIWRQKATDDGKYWDGQGLQADGSFKAEGNYVRDFGVEDTSHPGQTSLRVWITGSQDQPSGTPLSSVVKTVDKIQFAVDTTPVYTAGPDGGPVHGTWSADIYDVGVTLDTGAATSYQELLSIINQQLDSNYASLGLHAVVEDSTDWKITIVSSKGYVFADGGPGEVYGQGVAAPELSITQNPNQPRTDNLFQSSGPATVPDIDRLIFKAYEDRADNEAVDDNSVYGSTISLGQFGYAQDRVVGFADQGVTPNGTSIAQAQEYRLNFTNLSTEDVVTVTVNGVQYTLQVGVTPDGRLIPLENSVFFSQEQIQRNFLARLATYIENYGDANTQAGKVTATYDFDVDPGTITLRQVSYNDGPANANPPSYTPISGPGEATVFMGMPTISVINRSGGEAPSWTVSNNSASDIWLYDFNGRNNQLNQDNVLFWGNTEENRSVLATAANAGGELAGSDALIINGLADDLVGVPNNTATSVLLTSRTHDDNVQFFPNNGNFSVHGDDLLIGGTGNDDIKGLTGDDRIIGSAGTDTVDGGKDWYAVRKVGESKWTPTYLNAYEAQELSKDPTTYDIYLIEQTETGSSMVRGTNFVPYFQDTLQFQQADFRANTTFEIALDNFQGTGKQIVFPEGGAGTVSVNGGQDGVTTFTNFEHVRTVSGKGLAVAGYGQGNDTLNLEALSTASGGVTFALTDGRPTGVDWQNYDLWPGQVAYNTGDNFKTANAKPEEKQIYRDYISDADDRVAPVTVDGVENLIGGAGNDTLFIDETEAAKDNLFDGKGGTDAIIYQNNYNDLGFGWLPYQYEPSVTIKVEAASDTDTVTMQGGALAMYGAGSNVAPSSQNVVATDTLKSVEFLNLEGRTAQGAAENDLIDVTNLLGGATVNYDTGVISEAGTTKLIVKNITEMEQVLADANDTVIVADNMANAREDVANGIRAQDIEINTFMNYDIVDVKGATPKRIGLHLLETNPPGDPDTENNGTPQVLNYEEYKFFLGQDSDTVDYSLVNSTINGNNPDASINGYNPSKPTNIAVVVNFDPADDQANPADPLDINKDNPIHVLVDKGGLLGIDDEADGNGTTGPSGTIRQGNQNLAKDAGDRVDLLTGVENIVAAQLAHVDRQQAPNHQVSWLTERLGPYEDFADQELFDTNSRSIIDLTQAKTDVTLQYSFGYEGNPTQDLSLDRDIHVVKVTGPNGTDLLPNLNLLEYYDAGKSASINQPTAIWNQVEGSDYGDTIRLTGWEDFAGRVFNLRGGQNVVDYSQRKQNGIALTINEFDTQNVNPTLAHQFDLSVEHLNINGQGTGVIDYITGYNTKNTVAPGTMRIKGSQGDDDAVVNSTSSVNQTVFMGIKEGANDYVIKVFFTPEGQVNPQDYGLTLSGFEKYLDSNQDDTYVVQNLNDFVSSLTLQDNANPDRDTIKLTNGAFGTATIKAPINHTITVDKNLFMGSSANNANDLQWLGLDGAGNVRTTGNTGFDFKVLDISEVTNQTGITAAGSANFPLTAAGDEIVLGALNHISNAPGAAITGFSTLSLTNNTAGDSFVLNLDNDQLENGSGTRFFGFDAGLNGLDASRVDGRDLTLTAVDNDLVGVRLTGGSGNDQITGSYGQDVLRGGAGNDTLDGGTARGQVATVTLSGQWLNVFGAAATVTIDGVTVTEGNQVPQAASATQIGHAFADLWTTNPTLFSNYDKLDAVTFDPATGALAFHWNTSQGATPPAIVIAEGGNLLDQAALVVNGPAVTTPFAPDQVDTYVFEATAAKNGVDTITNFSVDAVQDKLDFTAFLGAIAAGDVDTTPGNFVTQGLDLVAGADKIGVVFNLDHVLTAADISTIGGPGFITVGDNGKAVILATADANGDGANDGVVNNYDIYYVQDTNSATGADPVNQTWDVKLVGTIANGFDISAVEIANAAHYV